MSRTFDKVRALVQRAEVRISDHGYDEMSDENILARDVLAGVFNGIVVEDYPSYGKGPCVLVLQKDLTGTDPRRLGNSEGFIVAGGCRDSL
jgi:hypothetical protein